MKAIGVALCLLLASAGVFPAKASQTGNEIREDCQMAALGPSGAGFELARATYCQGFVKGILFVGEHLDAQSKFCAPVGVTVGQAINVFLKFLNENPDITHYSAESLAVLSFQRAWPCK